LVSGYGRFVVTIKKTELMLEPLAFTVHLPGFEFLVTTAMLDRLLHHGHVLKFGPRSWRTKTELAPA
jgi:hypothetical protein